MAMLTTWLRIAALAAAFFLVGLLVMPWQGAAAIALTVAAGASLDRFLIGCDLEEDE